MRHLPTLAVLLLALIAAPQPRAIAAQSADIDHGKVARQALERHIAPSYRQLAEAFGKLEQSTSDYCGHPGDAALKALHSAFTASLRAWGRSAQITFGAIRAENRYERIWYWPDRKGIGRRQVFAALRKHPSDYADPAALAAKSIAVQGLTAFEHLLYTGDPKPPLAAGGASDFACRYAKAIAANLKMLAGEAASAWTADGAFGRLWLGPGPDNSAYLSARETTYALVKAVLEGVERVRDIELARPLGVDASRRVTPGPFDESGSTMVFIAARIAGLRAMLADTGLADEMIRAAEAKGDPQSAGDVRQALFELEGAEKRAQDLAAVPDIFGASPRRSEAVALGFPLKSAGTALARAAGQLTNMPVGFNASDGD